MERRYFLHSLVLGLVAMLLSPFWSKWQLRPIHRNGKRVRMYELVPGDVFTIELEGGEEPVTMKANELPKMYWSQEAGGFQWQINAQEA